MSIVHFHGNGEVVADHLTGLVPALEQLGYNCFLAEYRGYGQSNSTQALGAMLADVEPIIKSLNLPPEKLVLFGRSVGSIYALEAVARCPSIAGLILESGIADPLERLLLRGRPEDLGVSFEQLQAAVARDLNHQAKLAGYRGSTAPPTGEEIEAAARQFVRKVSGYRQPSRANEAVFEQAVAEIAASTQRLLDSLATRAASQ